ncbi:MmcQ/YjbR family DNA-binding protein [Leuconostoc mesenteroides]|nr:MmcQ/YjbR family DNA-binding protein [Leuconostoc mesenteroides]
MLEQQIKARMKHFQQVGNSLPHAKVYYRNDWELYYFDLNGKMFGLMSPTISENSIITLKGQPESNIELREMYTDVIAGYHVNKRHWNSIKLTTSQISNQEIDKMIENSYHLVFNNLPLSVQKSFTEPN